jgi:DNA-binding MarR family transcriptional regulator
MPSSNLEDFSRQVVEIMPLFVREFAKRESNELSKGNISLPQMVALDYISRKPCVSMTEIANILTIKTSSASVLIDRLIRQKMLHRKHDLHDRRVICISMTPKGRKVITQIQFQKRRSVRLVFGQLTQKERDQYLSVLLKVKSRLGEKQR